MRRALVLLALVPALAACSGRDAVEAQSLIQQAQQAQQALTSETFAIHMTIGAKGQTLSLAMTGGGYLKGPQAGDAVMDMKITSSVPLPFDSLEIAKVGGSAWMDIGGRRVAIPVDQVVPAGSASPLASFDLTPYVKDVGVAHDDTLNGKPVTKITGVLDTAKLVNGALSVLGRTGVPDLGGTIDDTRVVLYVDDATHLVTALLADLKLHGSDGPASLHLDVAVTGVDQPVALPSA